MDEKNAKPTKQSNAYEGYANTYSIEVLNSFNLQLQLKDTVSAIKNKLIDLLSEMKRFKLVTKLVLEFTYIENDDKTIYNRFCVNSKVKIVINESDTKAILESICSTIMSSIQILLENV